MTLNMGTKFGYLPIRKGYYNIVPTFFLVKTINWGDFQFTF